MTKLKPSTGSVIDKVPSMVHRTRLHRYVVDGYVVTSNLTPADVAGMTERQREGFFRRVLLASPAAPPVCPVCVREPQPCGCVAEQREAS